MKKTLIIYKSNTGFAERYAKWLCEELDCDLKTYEDRETAVLFDYDTIIFGGGIYVGSINGISWLKSKLPELEGKEVIVFAAGAMPQDAPQASEVFEKNFTQQEAEKIKTFYLHSGLCYERMSFKHKLMMKMLCKVLKKKQPEIHKVLSTSFDHSSKEALEPLLRHLNCCQ